MNSPDLTSKLFNNENSNEVNPFKLFEEWYEIAKKSEPNYANALSFATVDENGMPDVRILLMNGFDERGFVVYMNLQSAKGEQLKASPKAAAVFYWKTLKQQIRIRGLIEQVSDKEADTYFATRPYGSQIGAHASEQSRPLKSRELLLERTKQFEKQFPNTVPRPAHWSGYRILPLEIEFWKDGQYRLHDRIIFKRKTLDAPWITTRLNP